VWTYNHAYDAQLTAIEQGRADFMGSPLPPDRRDELTTRYSAQVHLFPYSATFTLFLNTRVAPFDSLAVRQAVNFAVDRAKAAALIEGVEGTDGFGGVGSSAITCQVVPAGIAGYSPYCPYTRGSTSDGVWLGPDLARARKLVAASGTRGQKVVFWTGPKPIQGVVGHLAVATLRSLGYRASLKRVEDDGKYFASVWDSRTRAQAGFFAWSQDYPSGSNFLAPLFPCRTFEAASADNSNIAEICDPRIDRAVDRALALQSDSGASNPAWAAADRAITDAAPWVPLVNTREVAVVSRRAHNVQSNPQWGVLADQIWIE
jgi:peptide/nickel transport system substrate-binding protein